MGLDDWMRPPQKLHFVAFEKTKGITMSYYDPPARMYSSRRSRRAYSGGAGESSGFVRASENDVVYEYRAQVGESEIENSAEVPNLEILFTLAGPLTRNQQASVVEWSPSNSLLDVVRGIMIKPGSLGTVNEPVPLLTKVQMVLPEGGNLIGSPEIIADCIRYLTYIGEDKILQWFENVGGEVKVCVGDETAIVVNDEIDGGDKAIQFQIKGQEGNDYRFKKVGMMDYDDACGNMRTEISRYPVDLGSSAKYLFLGSDVARAFWAFDLGSTINSLFAQTGNTTISDVAPDNYTDGDSETTENVAGNMGGGGRSLLASLVSNSRRY